MGTKHELVRWRTVTETSTIAVPHEKRIRELEARIARAQERIAQLEALPPTNTGKERMLHMAINIVRKHKRTLRTLLGPTSEPLQTP